MVSYSFFVYFFKHFFWTIQYGLWFLYIFILKFHAMLQVTRMPHKDTLAQTSIAPQPKYETSVRAPVVQCRQTYHRYQQVECGTAMGTPCWVLESGTGTGTRDTRLGFCTRGDGTVVRSCSRTGQPRLDRAQGAKKGITWGSHSTAWPP